MEAIRPAAAGRLEKAAILTESLGAGVPRKLTKGIRDIDDGHIRLLQVTKNESYRTVDSPNFDLRIWPREDLQLRHVSVWFMTGRMSGWMEALTSMVIMSKPVAE